MNIFYCLRFETPQPGALGPPIYIPQEEGGPVNPQTQGSLFVASYDSLGYGGGNRTRLHTASSRIQFVTDSSESESESYVTTDGQSAGLCWNKAPIWGQRPDFYCCQTVAGFLMWNALFDEKTGLLFTITAGPRQRRHSRVRVPWDSWPYFTISDSIDFPSRRLLRLAGSRWRHSTPPPHWWIPQIIASVRTHREHRFPQILYCCVT
jgi:hypothetical protein